MRSSRLAAASAALLTLCLPTLCLAQPAPRNQVILVHIKPDMLNEWMDLHKNELVPALKKAGVKSRTMYQTVLGNSFEFISVTPLDKFAQMDGPGVLGRALGPEGAARLTAKLNRCLEDRQVFISTGLPELSNAPPGELPAMGVFTRFRVAAGKMPEFESFVKSEVLPAYKKVDARYTMSRRGLGANVNDVVSITWLSKAADLDSPPPLVRALGEAGFAKLVVKGSGLATLVEQVVRRRVPELSY